MSDLGSVLEVTEDVARVDIIAGVFDLGEDEADDS